MTIHYGNEVQGITVGTLAGDTYHIEYTFTSPNNILANEGTYQGAANHLKSDTIQYIFDHYPQVEKVSAQCISPYAVRSNLRLGFKHME